VQNTCKRVMQLQHMERVVGQTGYGKTTALKHFHRNNNKVAYVLMTPSMSQKDCLRSIGFALGLKSLDGTMSEIMGSVSRKMGQHGGLLIIDDCGKVIAKFYRALQELYDRSEGRIGIILAGVPALKRHLLNFAARGKESYPELVSRISYTQELYSPSHDVIELACQSHGIVDMKAVNYIKRNIHDYRHLRNVIMGAKATGLQQITVDVIQELQIKPLNQD
jgi:DNA transposition AAA+ family ATPase